MFRCTALWCDIKLQCLPSYFSVSFFTSLIYKAAAAVLKTLGKAVCALNDSKIQQVAAVMTSSCIALMMIIYDEMFLALVILLPCRMVHVIYLLQLCLLKLLLLLLLCFYYVCNVVVVMLFGHLSIHKHDRSDTQELCSKLTASNFKIISLPSLIPISPLSFPVPTAAV